MNLTRPLGRNTSHIRHSDFVVRVLPEAGLTLIEAIVSISIVAVLSGVLLVAVFSGRRAAAVRTGAQAVGGFLREAAILTVNGTKDQSCLDALGAGASDAEKRTCSQYTVTVLNGEPTYTRRAVGGGDVATRALPAGASFDIDPPADRSVTFKLDPPTLTVHLDGAGSLARASSDPAIEIPIAHADPNTTGWRACVSSMGNVHAVSGAC